jgi:Fe-S-cluster containining protein
LDRLSRLSLAMGFENPAQHIVEQVYSVYEKIDHEVQSSTKDLNLPCHRGCDACCHEAVFLCAPEFLVVCDRLFESFSSRALRSLVEQMCAVAVEYEDELELLDEIDSGPERDEVAARVKFKCPLLSSEGACQIYPARELNGRTFGHAWDSSGGHAYGCLLTHDHLRIVDNPQGKLLDARQARMTLVNQVPLTQKVQVYPWWFRKYKRYLIDDTA